MFLFIQSVVNATCGRLIDLWELEGKAGHTFRFILLLCWVASVSAVYFAFAYETTDLHVRFWLGPWPKAALIGDAVLLFILSFVAVWSEWAHYGRHRDKRATGLHIQVFECCGSMCGRAESTRKQLGRLSVSVAFIALIVATVGATVTAKGNAVSTILMEKCGSDASTRELDATFNKLNAFYNACNGGSRLTPIRTCPGYAQTFPPPAPMVRYLEVLETKKHCSGFCQFASKSLFSAPFGATGARPTFPVRCATILAQEVQRVALLTGIPTIAFGASMAVMAFCMAAFDEL